MLGRLRSLAICAAALCASGCAISLNLPTNRFDSPETRGRLGKGYVDALGVQGSNTLVIVPDITATPPKTDPSYDRSNASYRFGIGVGILENLDVSLKLQYNACGVLEAKYQILGAPELEAKAGNFSLAATAGYGSVNTSGSASDALTGVSGNYSVGFASFDAALIAGKRLSDSVLLYGGPFYTYVSYSGKLDQSASLTSTYPLSGSVRQAGANLGLQIGSEAVYFKIEEAVASASAPNASQAGAYTGIMLGVRW